MIINTYNVIFWDFDGVIKDSVAIKADAFEQLFEEYGAEITEKIREHHLANGGMSRFDKIPLYGQWAGKNICSQFVEEYSKRFSKLVFQGVLNSPWVPGVDDYLRNNKYGQTFILVSATPQKELELILNALNLRHCFQYVYGTPVSKQDAISKSMSRLSISSDDCIMIGDALVDLEAANANNIQFLLRQHTSNTKVFHDYAGPSIRDFLDYEPS